MKTLVVLLLAVLTIGFVTSANHNRHHGRKSMRNNEESDPGTGSDVEWPNPGTIYDFTVPDEYTGGSGSDDGQDPGNGDEAPPARHHGRIHGRSRKN